VLSIEVPFMGAIARFVVRFRQILIHYVVDMLTKWAPSFAFY
jgi:hypothetical protein